MEGCISSNNKDVFPKNSVYDTINDSWSLIPDLIIPGVYELNYQRVCLTVYKKNLIAFWLRESPNYVYAILEKNNKSSVDYKWRAIVMPKLCPLRDTLTSNSMVI